MNFFDNNRIRFTATQRKNYVKRQWRVWIAILIVSFIVSFIVTSIFMQMIYQLTGRMQHVFLSYINIFYILVYGMKGLPVAIVFGILFGVGIIWRKWNLDLVDTLFDEDFEGHKIPLDPNATYGPAHNMREDEKETLLDNVPINKTTQTVIGMNDDGTVEVLKESGTGIGPHVFVSGCSGSGKTASQFFPRIFQAILRRESMICTDPKGELRKRTKKLADKYGMITKEFNLINPMLSDGIDFLAYVENFEDARTFTEIIMQNTSGDSMHTEDFWAKGERAAICFGILFVKESPKYTGHRTLGDVYDLLTSPVAELNDMAESLPATSLAKRQWRIFQTTPENSQGGIITGVATRLQILNDDAIRRITGTPDIDLILPGQKPCIYYVLQSDTKSSNNVIGALFFSLLFIKLIDWADAQAESKVDVPVNLLLDEFPNMGKIPDFPKKLSVIRSRDLRCVICAQDVGQIKDMYAGTLWANVISNCDTQICLGINEIEITGAFWEAVSGVMSILVDSVRDSQDKMTGFNSSSNTQQVSRGIGKRPVYPASAIMNMPNSKMLVKFRGHNIMATNKFWYWLHPMYKEIEDENYNEHVPAWWKQVEQEMESADSIHEYDWFIDEVTRIDERRKVLADKRKKTQEEKIEEEKRKKIEEETKVDRALNGSDEIRTLTPKEKILVYIRYLRLMWAAFVNWLHEGKAQNADGLTDEELAEKYGQKEEEECKEAYLDISEADAKNIKIVSNDDEEIAKNTVLRRAPRRVNREDSVAAADEVGNVKDSATENTVSTRNANDSGRKNESAEKKTPKSNSFGKTMLNIKKHFENTDAEGKDSDETYETQEEYDIEMEKRRLSDEGDLQNQASSTIGEIQRKRESYKTVREEIAAGAAESDASQSIHGMGAGLRANDSKNIHSISQQPDAYDMDQTDSATDAPYEPDMIPSIEEKFTDGETYEDYEADYSDYSESYEDYSDFGEEPMEYEEPSLEEPDFDIPEDIPDGAYEEPDAEDTAEDNDADMQQPDEADAIEESSIAARIRIMRKNAEEKEQKIKNNTRHKTGGL